MHMRLLHRSCHITLCHACESWSLVYVHVYTMNPNLSCADHVTHAHQQVSHV